MMKATIFWLRIASISALASLLFLACAESGGNTNSAGNSALTNSSASTNVNAKAPASTPEAYPKSAADAFLKSCEQAGSDRAFCSCVFEKVQAKYSFVEFSVIESKIIAGSPPDDFIEFTGKARAACTKQDDSDGNR